MQSILERYHEEQVWSDKVSPDITYPKTKSLTLAGFRFAPSRRMAL